MGSIVIAHSTISDTATFSGGSYETGLPLSNLKTAELYETARTTDATTDSTKFVIDFGEATEVSGIIVGPTNISAAGTWSVKGSSSTEFADGYASGSLDPGLDADEIDADAGTNLIHLLSSAQTYRYWEIAISDTTNAAGYIEMGRLFVPKLFAPSINYGYGSNGLSIEDRTRRQETLAGVGKQDRQRNRRIFSFGIDYLPDAEAFGAWYQFQRIVGYDQTVLVIADPEATGAKLQARSFWGTVSAMDPIAQSAFGVSGVGLTIREQF